MSDPTAPEMSGPSMREEIPVAELNVLLKFLQTLGDLPEIDLGVEKGLPSGGQQWRPSCVQRAGW